MLGCWAQVAGGRVLLLGRGLPWEAAELSTRKRAHGGLGTVGNGWASRAIPKAGSQACLTGATAKSRGASGPLSDPHTGIVGPCLKSAKPGPEQPVSASCLSLGAWPSSVVRTAALRIPRSQGPGSWANALGFLCGGSCLLRGASATPGAKPHFQEQARAAQSPVTTRSARS